MRRWLGAGFLLVVGCGRSALPVEDPPPFHIDCPEHFADCDGDGLCETDIGFDDNSCGRCGNVCGDGLVCGGERCLPPSYVVDVEVGIYATVCALRADHRVFCWGADITSDYGEEQPGSSVPLEVSLGGDAMSIEVNRGVYCARLRDGRGVCWGGHKPVHEVALPEVQVAKLVPGCALATDGTIWCWGSNTHGELGNGTTTPSDVPVQVTGIDDAVGLSSYCALHATGLISCWGEDLWQFTDPAIVEKGYSELPSTLEGLPLAFSIDGELDYCLLTAEGSRAYQWSTSPARSPTLQGVQLVCDNSQACLRRADGTVACGRNVDHLETVPGLTDAVDVSQGGTFACAVRARGDVVCWGQNNGAGQLGDGTREPHLDPRPVIGLDVP